MTIIPLAPASRPGSSDLPEGLSFRSACAAPKGAHPFERAQRAGPALPSYLVLHHAGFALPAALLSPRWALTPPFHPYLRCAPFADIPKVFLRAIIGSRPTGGLFSVALSVMRPLPVAPPGVTRRVCPEASSSQGRPFDKALFFALLVAGRDRPTIREVVSGLSSRRARNRLQAGLGQASDRPAHPPLLLYRGSSTSLSVSCRRLYRTGKVVIALCPPWAFFGHGVPPMPVRKGKDLLVQSTTSNR